MTIRILDFGVCKCHNNPRIVQIWVTQEKLFHIKH
jgi:hypothetical protein